MGLPLIARVECRSEGRGDDRPVAVWIGGVRMPITSIADERMEGPAEAGRPVRHVARVTLEDGRLLRLERTLPAGRWRAEILTDS